jgi:hypothetical protein
MSTHRQRTRRSRIKALPPIEPFTSETVLALLRDGVLKDDLPSPTDPAIAGMARCLNALQRRVRNWAGPWREEAERLNKIAEAIFVLAETLPRQGNGFAADPPVSDMAEEHADFAEMIAAGQAIMRRDLVVYNALVAAARDARECGLMPTVNIALFMSNPATHWKDFALELYKIFRTALPEASKLATYRFIVAVTFAISGERPTFTAVQSAFKKKRVGANV